MEKEIFTIKENTLSYGRGYVYSLQYHLVWCTKYRKKVLKDGIDLECKKMLQDLAEEYQFQILAMEVMPDHIHIFVDCPQTVAPCDVVRTLKSRTAVELFRIYPELKQFYARCGSLWSRGYFISSIRTISSSTVQKYIENQKSET